jgi:hypothetical protein
VENTKAGEERKYYPAIKVSVQQDQVDGRTRKAERSRGEEEIAGTKDGGRERVVKPQADSRVDHRANSTNPYSQHQCLHFWKVHGTKYPVHENVDHETGHG